MIKNLFLICLGLMLSLPLFCQNERKAIREGVKAYEEGNYAEAEVKFRKAESINQESYEAEFNTGAALYGQEKYEETVKQYEDLLSRAEKPDMEARIWHNVGNSLLEAQQYGPSIEAYKNSLRRDPTDEDTRYNLAYAKQKLKEQQQQQQQEQQENQDSDQDQQQQQQQQEQQENQDSDQDRQQDSQEEQMDQQEQQPAPREISKEDAERMLQAIQQQEKDVKEKVDRKKAATARVKTEKDW